MFHGESLPCRSSLVSSALIFFKASLSLNKPLPRRSESSSLERSALLHGEYLPRKNIFLAGLNHLVWSALRLFTARVLIRKSLPRNSESLSLERTLLLHGKTLPGKSLFLAVLNHLLASALLFFMTNLFLGIFSSSHF